MENGRMTGWLLKTSMNTGVVKWHWKKKMSVGSSQMALKVVRKILADKEKAKAEAEAKTKKYEEEE